MKKLNFFLLLLGANIGLAQTRTQVPKPEYMTKAQVIELIKQFQPKINVDSLLQDTDGDGVMDRLDREANTPKDCPVDTRGESLDSDGDGVKDCDDKEPFTQPNSSFDPNGVATRGAFHFDCSICDGYGNKNMVSVLPVIYFDKKAYKLKGQTQVDLKSIAMILNKNSRFCVAIEGYTDDDLKDENAVAVLAYQRAKAVADYLSMNYGIAADRLKIKIRGEENIIKGDMSEKDIRRYNRRVEIVVVECRVESDEMPKDLQDKPTKK